MRRALSSLPAAVRERLNNVDIVIAPRPSREQLHVAGLEPGDNLYGLYEGVPLTDRGSAYSLVLPDKITIFQRALEDDFADDDDLVEEVRITVLHEIAHHLGVSEEAMEELGLE